MTYKKIVAHLLEMTAQSWVEQLLEKNGIEYTFTSARETEMENDKERDTVYWKVPIEISRKGNIIPTMVIVGGTADDLCGICKSVIWDEKNEIIWMAAKETREKLDIDRFMI